jgi:hypothetical protein
MSGLDEHDEMYALEGEFKRLTAENAETRMVLRQFYGADEPITSADIARKMLDEIARLRAELLDAAELHLADEQSVRNMERIIGDWQRATERVALTIVERDERTAALTADLARVTAERDGLLRAARDVEPMTPDDPRDGICLVERRRLDALRAAVEACKEPTR